MAPRSIPATLRTFTAWRRLAALAFLVLLLLAGPREVRILEGSTGASRLLGAVPFVDPLATLEASLAARQATETMLLGTGLLVLAALVLGPVFCGWVCPLGLLLDLNQWVRRRIYRLRRKPVPSPTRVPTAGRFLLLGVLTGVALIATLPVFQVLSPIHLLVRALLFGATLGLLVVATILVVEWFVPRLWCRALCPLGALYGVLGRHAPFRVRIDPALAAHRACGLCGASCPMGIPVTERHAPAGPTSLLDAGCTRCGSCVDACPRGLLKLGFRA